MSCNTKSACREMLGEMHKNVEMGAESLINIMPKVEDKALRRELTAQLEKYGEFKSKIEKLIYSEGGTPKEEGMLTKMASKMGIAMNTMVDSTSTHISEMIIEGATMGVTNMTRLLREYENTPCSEDVLALARDIIKYEESTIENMKKYL